jgi:HPt (histidine-containing phosphotransfer) domain-containing protein
MMEKNNYDLILMDVQMPVMNGIDATKIIRSKLPAPKKDIPIIALTASVLRADLDLCFAGGMTGYVPKPFKPWQLINTIAEVTGRERSLEQKAKPPVKKEQQVAREQKSMAESITPYELNDKVTNLEYLTNFCKGDEKRMKKYINVYLNALPAFYNNIESGVANKDFVEIALHVHSFKPKWMMMGMKQTNDLGIKIDQLCKTENDKAFEDLKTLMADVKKSAVELAANA